MEARRVVITDWSKRKKIGWLIGAAFVAIVVGCSVAGILWDRTSKAPIIWFHNDNAPSGVG